MDNGNTKNKLPLYFCDPNKNTECKKTSCLYAVGKYKECDATSHREFAQLDENGEPKVKYATLEDAFVEKGGDHV